MLVEPGGHFVKVTIELSPEERAILEKRDLWNSVLVDKTTAYEVCSTDHLNGTPQRFNSAGGAKHYEEKLRTQILPRLKSLIEDNASVPTNKTFEL